MGVELWPVTNHPGASLGAAVAAAVGAQVFSDWSDIDRFVSLGEPVTPDESRKARYDEAYGLFMQATSTLTPISHGLARRASA